MTRTSVSALGGARLSFEQWGHGATVLAIHGFTGSLETWRPLAETLREEYSILAVDVIGHGASDSPRDPRWYSMEPFVQALEELLSRLGVEKVCWLGYSMGGRIALSAAVALPHRTAGLILESASPGLATEGERESRRRSDENLAGWIEEVGIKRFVDYWESISLWASQRCLPDTVRAALRRHRLANNPSGLANSLRGMGTGAQPPVHQRLGELNDRTLLIAGGEDSKFRDIAREMTSGIRSSHLEIVPGAGHSVHLEQPERFNALVLEFLRANPPVSSHPRSRSRL